MYSINYCTYFISERSVFWLCVRDMNNWKMHDPYVMIHPDTVCL